MYLRHLAAYNFVWSMATGRRVLDLGSGAGYGSAVLADCAQEVIALDVALDALLTTKLKATNVATVAGNGARLPLRDKSFDLVVSFQVIEHTEDETRYLEEVRRVLTPGGLFVVSTPNKALRLLPFQPPFNPYHVREYGYRAFKRALGSRFDDIRIQGLCATPEVMEIERERHWRNPLKVYMELIAQKTLPSRVLRVLQDRLGILRPREDSGLTQGASYTSLSGFEDTYSVNDFWVGTDDVGESLDLIGICRRT
jgi:ubiquinone/menaquinone biosynthesis C-methylase UbiE